MSPDTTLRRIVIFDTTLRDGEQSPGASMNLAEKLEVAQALADLGVDVIEAGFPIASPGEQAERGAAWLEFPREPGDEGAGLGREDLGVARQERPADLEAGDDWVRTHGGARH